MAWCLKFINNIKTKLVNKNSNNLIELNENLTVVEILSANKILVKWIQAKHFKNKILNLKNNLPFINSSKIISLNPFID